MVMRLAEGIADLYRMLAHQAVFKHLEVMYWVAFMAMVA